MLLANPKLLQNPVEQIYIVINYNVSFLLDIFKRKFVMLGVYLHAPFSQLEENDAHYN